MPCKPKKGEVELKDLKTAIIRLENFVNNPNRPNFYF